MQSISRNQLESFVDEWDAAVEQSHCIDAFCSRSAWQLCFHDAFAPERPLYLLREAGAMVLLAERTLEPGLTMLEPLENMWGFTSPLAGDDAAALLADWLCENQRPLLLQGLPRHEGILSPLLEALEGHYGIRVLRPTTRFVASLDGGIDGWQSRRSASFRRNLRAEQRRVARAGIEFDWLEVGTDDDLDALYRRVLSVERRSRKYATGASAASDPMRSFYAALWPRLAAARQLRLLFAQRDGETLGYLHGAVVGRHFRGLQFSFDQQLSGLGLGNALQYEALGVLCREGVRSYDLGSYSDYKGRWAEPGLMTLGLFLQPRSAAG